jgi:hypothetical protein
MMSAPTCSDATAFSFSAISPTTSPFGAPIGRFLNTLVESPFKRPDLIADTAILAPIPKAGHQFTAEDKRSDLTAIARIRILATYPEGWKGPGSKAASRAAAEDAETFARVFFKTLGIYSPLINLSANGEINFYWKTPKVTIDLGFYGSGTYSYYAVPSPGQPIADDDVPIDKPLPNELLDLLHRSS